MAKTVNAIICAAFAIGGVVVGLIAWTDGERGPKLAGKGHGGVSLLMRASGLCVLLIALIFAYILLHIVRRAAWLRGTDLTIRGAIGAKHVDLATAVVSGGLGEERQLRGHLDGRYRQAIIARDAGTGTELRLPLYGRGLDRLPPGELNALADAIMTGRRETDADYAAAAGLAIQLRVAAAGGLGT